MILECVMCNAVEVLCVMREEIMHSKLYKLSLYERKRLLQNM